MEELDLATIKHRSVKGVLALTSRTFFLQIINFGAMLLLTIFLSPEIFGIYFVVCAVVNFLNYFSDIGLAAALIQKKEDLTDDDLKTTFTIQQFLVIILVVLSLLSSRLIAGFYNLTPAGLILLRALIVSFFLSSLKTIPSILLERKLDFNRLIIPQIVETLLFNLVAVTLAWKGFGITSFTWAVLTRGLSGLILIYLLSPWQPKFALHRGCAKKLLSFGVPFQLNSLLALVKDDLLIVFLGKALPMTQVGYLGWAQKWANFPLRFIMDSVTKVTFPAYSRLQENLAALQKAVEKSLFSVCFLTFPALAGLALLSSSLTEQIPRYLKWQPALFSLYVFCLQASLACVSTTLTNTLNATGRIKKTLNLMIFWTVLTWLFTPLFIYFWGFNGVAPAALLVALSVFLPIRLVRKIVRFDLKETVVKPLTGALMMAAVLYFLVPHFATSLPNTILLIILGAIIYLSAMWFFAQEKISESFNLILGAIKK